MGFVTPAAKILIVLGIPSPRGQGEPPMLRVGHGGRSPAGMLGFCFYEKKFGGMKNISYICCIKLFPMDTQTLNQKKRMLAEFMGWHYIGDKRNLPWVKRRACFSTPRNKYFKPYIDWFKYDTSWDRLMPVVRYIVLLCTAENNDELFMSDQYTSILDTVPMADLESSFKVVVEFVEWYNTNFTPEQQQTYFNNISDE